MTRTLTWTTCALLLSACRTDPDLDTVESTESTTEDTEDANSETDGVEGSEATGNSEEMEDPEDPEDTNTVMDLPDPDTGGGPSACGEGTLALEWTAVDELREQGSAVALGDGVVAWTAVGFQDLSVRLHDTEGTQLWSDTAPAHYSGSNSTISDVQIAADGTIALSSTIVGAEYDVLMRWYDGAGAQLQQTQWADPGFDFNYGGLTMIDGSDIILAGHAQEQLFLARYDFGDPAVPSWTSWFDEGGANWASDVEVGASGELFVSGHSNTVPGPVVLSYSAEGELLWNYAYPAPEAGLIVIGWALSLDAEGRLLIASERTNLIDNSVAGRVDRIAADGSEVTTLVEFDYLAKDVEVDLDGRLVVAGSRPGEDTVVVQRYGPGGVLESEYTREGSWAHDLEIDEECAVYVVGQSIEGGWLDKLE